MSIILTMLGYTIMGTIILVIAILSALAFITWMEKKGYYNP